MVVQHIQLSDEQIRDMHHSHEVVLSEIGKQMKAQQLEIKMLKTKIELLIEENERSHNLFKQIIPILNEMNAE